MTKPVQVYLAADDLERLERWSRARGCTKSEAMRVAIRVLTREKPVDPLLGLKGCIIDGLPADVSENVDRYLNETYVAETAPRYRRRSRTRSRLR